MLEARGLTKCYASLPAGLAQMGGIGIRAVVAVTLLAPMVYVLSYYRYFIRIPETLDTTLRNRKPRNLFPIRLMDRFALRSPFERATYRFAMKTLLRNERHSLLFGAFAGLGFVIASQTLVSAFNERPGSTAAAPSAALISVPLTLAYFLICGLRFVFDLPAEIRANWVHKVILDHRQPESADAARKVVMTFVLPWILAGCLPLYLFYWGWAVGGALVAGVDCCVLSAGRWPVAAVRENSFCLRLSCLETERHCHRVALRPRAVGFCFHPAQLGARFAAEERLVSLGLGGSAAGCAVRATQVAP
jgi:hypothetical protein